MTLEVDVVEPRERHEFHISTYMLALNILPLDSLKQGWLKDVESQERNCDIHKAMFYVELTMPATVQVIAESDIEDFSFIQQQIAFYPYQYTLPLSSLVLYRFL